MSNFSLFAGLIIPALVLNTIASFVSIFLLAYLPQDINKSVYAYAWVILILSFTAWAVILGGGTTILYKEQSEPITRSFKVGMLLTMLFILTLVFIFSCITLSVLQGDLQPTLVNARNLTAAVLSLTFVAWLLILATNYTVLTMGYVKESPESQETEMTPPLPSRPPPTMIRPPMDMDVPPMIRPPMDMDVPPMIRPPMDIRPIPSLRPMAAAPAAQPQIINNLFAPRSKTPSPSPSPLNRPRPNFSGLRDQGQGGDVNINIIRKDNPFVNDELPRSPFRRF